MPKSWWMAKLLKYMGKMAYARRVKRLAISTGHAMQINSTSLGP
jgi:hypothetical protein